MVIDSSNWYTVLKEWVDFNVHWRQLSKTAYSRMVPDRSLEYVGGDANHLLYETVFNR